MATAKTGAKEPKPVVFILVPELKKPVFKGRIGVTQFHAAIENGQQTCGESTDMLSPDGFGVYQWMDDHPNHDARLRAVNEFKKKKNVGRDIPFIIGPFDDRVKAVKEMNNLREKPVEEVNAALKVEVEAQNKQIADLKKQIADAQKSAGATK